MKRLLSLTLSAALLAALTLPASAEESHDARLAKVTQAVKAALELDTDAYETFHGGVSEEGEAQIWDLNWEGDRRSLSVQALEDGTLVSLYRWTHDPGAESRWTRFPAFPDRGGAEERAAAQSFLDRVLREGEAVELKDPEGGLSLNGSANAWSGTIALHGLPSPLHYSIRVENGLVEQFSRDVPETYTGGVPSPEATASAAKAREDLNGTLKLRLEYVREDGKAVLRYTPEDTHRFLVDAKTGELTDLTELEESLSGGFSRAAAGDNGAPAAKEMETMSAGEAGLTEAEQEGVREMEGVLSKEALDKALRAESAYGLRGYALTGAAYAASWGGESGAFCSLRYARTDGGERRTRTITVDARTGAVKTVQSQAPQGQEKTLGEEEALKKAEAFLKSYCPDRKLVLYQKDSALSPWRTENRADWSFTFAQAVNGLPFRENAVFVGVDGSDGSIYSLSSQWDADVDFEEAGGLVSMDTALSAWAGSYETALAYRRLPRAGEAEPVYALCLSYGLEREEACSGVNAKTGALVREERSGRRTPLHYTDLSGSPAKAEIEKLAGYGVGYQTGAFRPGKNITQWELVCLAYSLQGEAADPGAVDADGRENQYFAAYRMGLLRASERDDGAVLTRADVARMLLNAAGYGPAARLDGIYTCGYADKDAIPQEGLGYAAIAEALGMAAGTYAGNRAATRGEAAAMLCRVLERDT